MTDKSKRIAELNDRLRNTGEGGQLIVTEGVRHIAPNFSSAARIALGDFDDFQADTDPLFERDFGAFELEGHKLVWKVDYYENDQCKVEAGDASDPRCWRVLTIMLESEYSDLRQPNNRIV